MPSVWQAQFFFQCRAKTKPISINALQPLSHAQLQPLSTASCNGLQKKWWFGEYQVGKWLVTLSTSVCELRHMAKAIQGAELS